jgi:hypothetical protein
MKGEGEHERKRKETGSRSNVSGVSECENCRTVPVPCLALAVPLACLAYSCIAWRCINSQRFASLNTLS